MKLTKKDVEEILEKYDLGKLQSLVKVLKNDTVSLSQIIKTTKGIFSKSNEKFWFK